MMSACYIMNDQTRDPVTAIPVAWDDQEPAANTVGCIDKTCIGVVYHYLNGNVKPYHREVNERRRTLPPEHDQFSVIAETRSVSPSLPPQTRRQCTSHRDDGMEPRIVP
jgi:hypothetical protein